VVNIQLDDVRVRLARRTVVDGVSLTFAAGTLTGIVGPNGAGKSTLARALMALLSISGRVLVDGDDAATLPRPELARRLAYLPQGQVLHWPLAVERLVGLGRLPHLAPMSRIGPADRDAIERAMARADVLHLRDRIATELSGGERARVLLARALASEAPALVADEPLASLDPGHQVDVMELLRNEAGGGALVIAVLHDLTMAWRYCDRLVLIDGGRVVAEGKPSQVLTPANLRSVYGIEARVEGHGTEASIIPLGRTRRPHADP
jgi:iron complex transport system ATP-binding protein